MTAAASQWRQWIGRAAAELAIVVLGVSVALWADNWAAERNDREKEAARLVALRDNVVETLVDVEFHLEESELVAEQLRAIITQPSDGPEAMRARLRWALFYGPVFSPELNVYDDLKSSGELSLLTNPALRSALARMDASMGRVQLAQSDLSNVQQLHIDSFAIDSTPVRLFYAEEIGLTEVDTGNEDPFDFVDDPRFRGRMVLKLDLVTQLEIRFREAGEALVKVRELIDEQLETG